MSGIDADRVNRQLQNLAREHPGRNTEALQVLYAIEEIRYPEILGAASITLRAHPIERVLSEKIATMIERGELAAAPENEVGRNFITFRRAEWSPDILTLLT